MKKKMYLLIVAITSIAIVIVTVSYAWYYQHAALATLMDIVPPDSINIVPIDIDGKDVAMLDLDFNEKYGDIKNDETGTVTIRRPVYIYSSSPVHQLEVVHTTNLNKLSFKIYPATKNENGSFTYNTGISLSGEYINKNEINPSLADPASLHNYKDGDHVEEHAYPLYWLAVNSGHKDFVDKADKDKIVQEVSSKRETKFDPAKQVNKTYYTTYYYLEISWQENSKDTDLFYIMAQNIAVTAEEEGSISTP